jgi:2-polyprenyl-6-methoxyphenol hydroxylase-like FAD-dependent oxidoreductase
VVIGGSIAGLFAALLLRRAGWLVDVYEGIGAELAGRGAGIVTHKELFDVLARAGIETAAAALGVSVPGRRVLDRDGRVAGELASPQVLTSWGRLYGILKDAIPANCYHHGQNLVDVTEHSDRVVARFADGTRASGDLLIAADGIFSTVRAQCAQSHLRQRTRSSVRCDPLHAVLHPDRRLDGAAALVHLERDHR